MFAWSRGWEHWYRRALPAYWIFLFCGTHFPKPLLPGRLPHEDKLAHFLAFAVLAFLLWRCAESLRRPLSWRFVWLGLVVLGCYAAIDEYLQRFVNRSVTLSDFLANLGGIVAVLLVLELRRRRTQAPGVAPSAAGPRSAA